MYTEQTSLKNTMYTVQTSLKSTMYTIQTMYGQQSDMFIV